MARADSAVMSSSPELFAAVLAELRREKPATSNTAGLLATSLIAFVILGAAVDSVSTILVLVAVLFFHELGHLAAMRVFGYRDLRVFFIPFLGAAAGGKKDRALGWQEVIVLLMGPAPGLLLGIGLIMSGAAADSLLEMVAVTLVSVNALNLLPFEPFDGGRVATILLFANHPKHQARLGALTAAVLAFLAFRSGYWILAVVAGLQIVAWPFRSAMAGFAEQARARHGTELAVAPTSVASADDALLRSIFDDIMVTMTRGKTEPFAVSPVGVANQIKNVYNAAITPATKVGPRLGLSFVYVALLVPSALLMLETF